MKKKHFYHVSFPCMKIGHRIVRIMGNAVSVLRNATTNKATFLHKFDCVLFMYKMLHN